ncbi:polysaccharide biosynthesis protein [Lactiplantibacillus herbarum]|uniref:polysaccharide biosynthesis protein n=1 Tax=Lactiplantibacillus herbarum TaxID=1670446 RepID=UPI000AD1EF9F|nr:polysaccharide biosynthesis protein [Lactiplantibacillus herbarum]
MKKRLGLLIGVLAGLLLLLGYVFYALSIQRGQDTTIRIHQVDQNGRPIISPGPITLVGKAGHRNPFHPEIEGYVLANRNPLSANFPRHNQTIELKYRSALTLTQIRQTLAKAKYLQVGTQNTATPVFNEAQYQGKKETVARISVSGDGRSWTKLPISYPRAQLDNPSLLYQKRRLTLFDGTNRYWTTNFKDWHVQRLALSSPLFKNGRIQTVLPGVASRQYLVVRARDRQTQRSQLYYQVTQNTTNRNQSWHQLRLNGVPTNQVIGINQIGQRVYVLRRYRQHIRIYRAKQINGSFKSIATVKLSHTQRATVTTASLLPVAKHRYQLNFSSISHQDVQTITNYQQLDKRFRTVGSHHQLITDYLWVQFQTSQQGNG